MDNMTALYLDAKLTMTDKALPPDSFNILSNDFPTNDFVVSRTREGVAVSRYGDLVWDFTVYDPEGKPSTLIFTFWDQGPLSPERAKLVEEIKQIFFILIWLRDKEPLSFGTLRNYLTVVREIAKFAEKRQITLKAVIGDTPILLEFIRSQNSGWLVETLSSLLLLLMNSSYQNLSIKTVEPNTIKLLQKHNKQYRLTLKQHAPIPTRIYSELLANFIDYLDEWEKHETELFDLILDSYFFAKNRADLRTYSFHYAKFLNRASTELREYIISKTGNFTLKSLTALITDTQVICKLVIQAFTGMRDDEVKTIPYKCIKEVFSNSQKHILIIGRTTKLNHGIPIVTQWVTSLEGLKAVRIAQKIADKIYEIHNAKNVQHEPDIFEYPLFISASSFGFTGQPITLTTTKFRIGTLYSKKLINKMLPKIEHADLKELEQIDPHRAWRSEEKFHIGQYWGLTSHQLRRSLALYAQRSGLVSLPSLRRQLQHITNEMSSYYSRGSSFAKNLIADDETHFANEWQQTQAESSALAYIFNVLMSNTPLYGGHVHWVENTLKSKEGLLLIDRKQTLKRFKNGEIAYKETIIGGCTKVGACNQAAINWLQINCLKDNCRNLIVSLPKLERVITAQEKLIKFLDITSLEYRTEISHLQILNETKAKMMWFR